MKLYAYIINGMLHLVLKANMGFDFCQDEKIGTITTLEFIVLYAKRKNVNAKLRRSSKSARAWSVVGFSTGDLCTEMHCKKPSFKYALLVVPCTNTRLFVCKQTHWPDTKASAAERSVLGEQGA